MKVIETVNIIERQQNELGFDWLDWCATEMCSWSPSTDFYAALFFADEKLDDVDMVWAGP